MYRTIKTFALFSLVVLCAMECLAQQIDLHIKDGETQFESAVFSVNEDTSIQDALSNTFQPDNIIKIYKEADRVDVFLFRKKFTKQSVEKMELVLDLDGDCHYSIYEVQVLSIKPIKGVEFMYQPSIFWTHQEVVLKFNKFEITTRNEHFGWDFVKNIEWSSSDETGVDNSSQY